MEKSTPPPYIWTARAVYSLIAKEDRPDGMFPKVKKFIQHFLNKSPYEGPRIEKDEISGWIRELETLSHGFRASIPRIQSAILIIAALIQFTDETAPYLPPTVKDLLPSTSSISELEKKITNSSGRITPYEIFTMALEVAEYDIWKALLLASFTCRWRARLSDQLIFGNSRNSRFEEIKGTRKYELLKQWWDKLIPFQGAEGTKTNTLGDVGGDYYYFFTSATLAFLGKVYPPVILLSRFGPRIMRIVRKLAGPGTVSSHEPAASLGHRFGSLLYERVVLPKVSPQNMI